MDVIVATVIAWEQQSYYLKGFYLRGVAVTEKKDWVAKYVAPTLQLTLGVDYNMSASECYIRKLLM